MDYHLAPTDTAFPFELFNTQKVVKACSQCGTSKTPQWREGPEGPKTLCNACGVKRCRQLRVASDSKRRSAVPVHKPPTGYYLAQDSLADEESCFTESRAAKQQRRAPPKAHHALHWSTKAGELDSESLDTPANSLSAGTAGNSDSAEEDAWSPRCASPPAPPSPTYAAVDPECKAAVNLLAMSVRPSHKSSGHHAGHSSPASDDQDMFSKPDNLHRASMAGKPRHYAADAVLSGRQQQEQEEQQRLMLEVQELERQAIVAEAAVAAVAQVLAKKQAIATHAHYELSQAQSRARGTAEPQAPESTGSMPQSIKRHHAT